MKPVLRCILTLGFLLLASAGRAETVTVYTNADFPPLMIDVNHGLYPDMVDYLNQLKLADLEFKIDHLPRKRLQMTLENNDLDGIVIGMMPQWFDDAEQKKYLWTAPFFIDHFVLVSAADKPMTFATPGAPKGTVVGMTFGYVYQGIDEWTGRHGLVREDAPSEQRNLEKLVAGRFTAAIVAESVLRHYLKTHKVSINLVSERIPGPRTERRFLVPRSKQKVFDKIAPALLKLRNDPVWQRINDQY